MGCEPGKSICTFFFADTVMKNFSYGRLVANDEEVFAAAATM